MHTILTLLIFGPTISLSLDVSSFRKFSKSPNTFSTTSSEKCAQQQKSLSTAIDNGDQWSLRMLDSSGNMPVGLFSGNVVDMGLYDECISIVHNIDHEYIKGKYCYGGLVIPLNQSNTTDDRDSFVAEHIAKQLGFGDLVPSKISFPPFGLISVCIPDACLPTDLFGNFGVDTMCTTDEQITFDAGDIAFIVFIAVIVALICLSTVYDVYMKKAEKQAKYPIMVAFSVYTNGKQILNISKNPDQIGCFSGLRVISSVLVMGCHRYVVMVLSRSLNIFTGFDLQSSWQTKYMSTMTHLSVDNFFFMSGVLLSYNFLSEIQKPNAKLDVLKMYRHRLLRLVPALAVVFFFQVTLARRLGSGPTWNITMDNIRNNCLDNWWSVLFFLQNYNKADTNCLHHTWTVATDVQMVLLSPIILVPLAKYPRETLKYLFPFAISISILIPLLVCYVYDIRFPTTEFFEHYYTLTHTRSSSWLIGSAFGAILFKYKQKNVKPELSGLQNLMIWCLVLSVIMVLPIWEHMAINRDIRLERSLGMALERPIWSLCLCWITFACIYGYGVLGILNQFLSAGFLQVLAKISYCTYLVHLSLLYINASNQRTLDYFSPYSCLYKLCGDVTFAYAAGFFLTLAFELPVAAIEKAVFKSGCDGKTYVTKGFDDESCNNNVNGKKAIMESFVSNAKKIL